MDTVIFAGFDTDKQANADRVIKTFHAFIEENKDEIIALRIIYDQRYKERPMAIERLKVLYKKLTEGDIVVFDSVSRMSRDAEEGFEIYQDLYNRGVSLVFLKEPLINTDTYKAALSSGVPLTGTNVDYILKGINQYLMSLAKEQIRLAFEQAQKEVDDLHQRTKEGIETARLAGKQIGQKPGIKLTTKKSVEAKKIIEKRSKSFKGDLSDAEVMKLTGLSRNTYYKYKRELKGF